MGRTEPRREQAQGKAHVAVAELPVVVVTCITNNTHLTSCDDDGYCNACGHQERADTEVMSMWTIYDHPLDYPEGFIARRFEISHSKVPGEGIAVTTDTLRGLTLDDVRLQLPEGMVVISRSPKDEPQILETWL